MTSHGDEPADYTHLWGCARYLYQTKDFGDTTNFVAIKKHIHLSRHLTGRAPACTGFFPWGRTRQVGSHSMDREERSVRQQITP